MAINVRVRNGRVEEYENGSRKRSYGSGIIAAATDGELVAAINSNGKIEEYVKGSRKRSYGNGDAISVQVSGGTVYVQTSKGKTEEYVNGSRKRSY